MCKCTHVCMFVCLCLCLCVCVCVYVCVCVCVCVVVMCSMKFCPSRTDLTDQSIRDRLDGSDSSFCHPFSRRGFCLPHSLHPSPPHPIPTTRLAAVLVVHGIQPEREAGRKEDTEAGR